MKNSPLRSHGGYRNLKSFQLARLVYDLTVHFCSHYIERGSRTRDQMVQAARSGVQNIAEGSQASATSKKTEIKLTQVARASLEELRLDCEDYLRRAEAQEWPREHPLAGDLIRRRFQNAQQVLAWIDGISGNSDLEKSLAAANVILVLTRISCKLLDRQVAAQVREFGEEGGFSERLYRFRRGRRGG